MGFKDQVSWSSALSVIGKEPKEGLEWGVLVLA